MAAGFTAAAVLVLLIASLGPSMWADLPAALRLGGTPPEGADAGALFRAAGRGGAPEGWDAVRAALKGRFPPGPDAAALADFLSFDGPDRRASCGRSVPEAGVRHLHCHVRYGSLAVSILGLDRWRGGEWVVGVALAPESNAIERISVRAPLLGKG